MTGLNLTLRDVQTLDHTYIAKYLTAEMVQRLLYPPGSITNVRHRLFAMTELHLLDRRRPTQNDDYVYFVGTKARPLLAPLHDVTPSYIKATSGIEGRGINAHLFIPHDLVISGLYVRAVLECRRYGFLLDWQNDKVLAHLHLGLNPDAWLAVKSPTSGAFQSYIEYTNTDPKPEVIRKKVKDYVRLWEKTVVVPVLWFLNSRRDIEAARKQVELLGYQDYFALGEISHSAEFLTGKQWWLGDKHTAFIPKEKGLPQA